MPSIREKSLNLIDECVILLSHGAECSLQAHFNVNCGLCDKIKCGSRSLNDRLDKNRPLGCFQRMSVGSWRRQRRCGRRQRGRWRWPTTKDWHGQQFWYLMCVRIHAATHVPSFYAWPKARRRTAFGCSGWSRHPFHKPLSLHPGIRTIFYCSTKT